ncbi:hypothetical protein BIZ35_00290 [Heyndrickxia coagulans]|nr:hypothetical protein BIZ35_00290 [Heyndrickxia coagulans]
MNELLCGLFLLKTFLRKLSLENFHRRKLVPQWLSFIYSSAWSFHDASNHFFGNRLYSGKRFAFQLPERAESIRQFLFRERVALTVLAFPKYTREDETNRDG